MQAVARAPDRIPAALALAVLVPAGLLGGALAFQYLGGLYPCVMCIWQRWPHALAIALGLCGLVARQRGRHRIALALLALAGGAIAASGAIGAFHAGVELKLWPGPGTCSATSISGPDSAVLAQIIAAPVTRCDEVPWSLLGISMAGYNALISFAVSGAIAWLIRTSSRN